MTITIKVNTGNAAFTDNPNELQGLLRVVAMRAGNGEKAFTLRDSNGNTVGTVKVTGR